MHRRTLRALLATGVATLCVTSPAMAGQVTISGTADTTACTIFSDTALHPGCDTSQLTVGFDETTSEQAHTVIKFNILDNLPAGAEVTSATLRMHSTEAGSSTALYSNLWDWDVALADWDTPDGVDEWGGACCWGIYPLQGDWYSVPDWNEFSVGNWVQEWTKPTDAPPNGGFMLMDFSTLASYDGPASANPPELVIDYDL